MCLDTEVTLNDPHVASCKIRQTWHWTEESRTTEPDVFWKSSEPSQACCRLQGDLFHNLPRTLITTMAWLQISSCWHHSTPLHSPIAVWKAHFLWRPTGLWFWGTDIKVKVVITSETVKSKSKYQPLVCKETTKVLIKDKRSLNSILSVFSIEIFLNDVSTINTESTGQDWRGDQIWLQVFVAFFSRLLYPVKRSLIWATALSHTIHPLLSGYKQTWSFGGKYTI